MSSQRPKSPQDAWLLELIPPREGASVLVWGPRPSQAPNNYPSRSFPNLNLLVSPIPCIWRDRMTVSLLPECDLLASCERPVNCMLLLTTSCRGGNGFSLDLPQWVTKLWMPEPLHINCVTSRFSAPHLVAHLRGGMNSNQSSSYSAHMVCAASFSVLDAERLLHLSPQPSEATLRPEWQSRPRSDSLESNRPGT